MGARERTGRVAFLPALLGIGFVALLVVAGALTSTPDGDASDAKWTSWFSSSTHRTDQIVAAFLFVLGGLCLLGFLTLFSSRINSPEESPLKQVARGGAIIGAAAIGIGGVSQAVVAGAVAFGNAPVPSADVLRYADNLGFPIIAVPGMISIALAVVLLSLEAGKTGLFGKGMTIFSVVVGVVTLFSFLFFPMLVLCVWCIVAGIVVSRRWDATAVGAAG